jgi:hypothetical protein
MRMSCTPSGRHILIGVLRREEMPVGFVEADAVGEELDEGGFGCGSGRVAEFGRDGVGS